MKYNPILAVDEYKFSHFNQYPEDVEFISSYIESRGGMYDSTLFFGLQMFIKEYLTTPFTLEDIDEAEEITLASGLPFNRQGYVDILYRNKGYWPILIQAVKEGTIVPNHNVLVQVKNTNSDFPCVTSLVESFILQNLWYPITVATRSHNAKKIIKKYLLKTSDNPDNIMFSLNDFGFRGVSSKESAGIGGCAHLVNFMGSDNVEGKRYARRYYGETTASFSVVAAEHSTITSWGRNGELNAYENILDKNPNGIVSIVSDSYDIYNAISNIFGGPLKEKIVNRNGKTVIRPDSSTPWEIVPAIITGLMNNFGYSTNSKGYSVLPPCIGVIQGDGINDSSIEKILSELEKLKISTENVIFGMGGELLQNVTRDTQKFAYKASAIKSTHDYEWVGINKDPITDKGKRSKKGRLALIKNDNGELETIQEYNLLGKTNYLEPVFDSGKVLRNQTLKEIRELAKI